MKRFFVKELWPDDEIVDFFMVKSSEIRIGSNKKAYLDIMLSDSTGDINGKKWDISEDDEATLAEIQAGDIVKVKGRVNIWNNSKQIKILRMRKAESADEDQYEIGELIKAAPEKSQDMYDYIYSRAKDIADEDYRKIAVWHLEKYKDKLMYYPAAQSNHHAQFGGLLYHIKRMLMSGDKLCDVYESINRDMVACGVIMHDIEKINEIRSNELGISDGYSVQGMLLGHIVQGVVCIDRYEQEEGMDPKKALLLKHMILSHHYEPEFGSPKRPMFLEAELLHYLDIIDARVFDIEEALAGVCTNGFSDRVWTLENRRLYRW
ncbi:MAG: 3'-5' exoribonuclease YhaM family protein [Eubacteriales bacterium]